METEIGWSDSGSYSNTWRDLWPVASFLSTVLLARLESSFSKRLTDSLPCLGSSDCSYWSWTCLYLHHLRYYSAFCRLPCVFQSRCKPKQLWEQLACSDHTRTAHTPCCAGIYRLPVRVHQLGMEVLTFKCVLKRCVSSFLYHHGAKHWTLDGAVELGWTERLHQGLSRKLRRRYMPQFLGSLSLQGRLSTREVPVYRDFSLTLLPLIILKL